VDCVLIYNVNGLSRSLLDFARLVDRFDQHSVSFCFGDAAVQDNLFAGRLTLNVLLLFAQFEREIIGERTRDKMSAARRKRKWVAGTPVLGYDIVAGGGRLIVNDKESPQGSGHVRVIPRTPVSVNGCRGSRPTAVEEQILDLAKWPGALGTGLRKSIVAPVTHQCDLCRQCRTSGCEL
jgi:hypothetical protein